MHGGLWTCVPTGYESCSSYTFKVSANTCFVFFFVNFQNMHVQITCMEGFSVYPGVFNLFGFSGPHWLKNSLGSHMKSRSVQHVVCRFQEHTFVVCDTGTQHCHLQGFPLKTL